MYCSNCGKQITDGAYSCPFCGTVFDSAVNQAASQQQPQQAQQPQQPQQPQQAQQPQQPSQNNNNSAWVNPPQQENQQAQYSTPQYNQQNYQQAQYSAPQYNQQNYQQTQYTQYSAPQYNKYSNPAGSWNSISIVAFVLSFFFSLPALIVGIVAMNKHKADPTLRGKGLAIAAIILSSLSMVLGFIFIMIFIGTLGTVYSGDYVLFASLLP